MVRGMNYTRTFSTTIFENGTKESEKKACHHHHIYKWYVRLHIMGRSIILNNTRITFSIMVSCSSKCLLLYNIHYSSNNHAQLMIRSWIFAKNRRWWCCNEPLPIYSRKKNQIVTPKNSIERRNTRNYYYYIMMASHNIYHDNNNGALAFPLSIYTCVCNINWQNYYMNSSMNFSQ